MFVYYLEVLDFEQTGQDRKSVIDRYIERHIQAKPELENVSLLEFATTWDWKGSYHKRGSRGAKTYVLNISPKYSPNRDDPDQCDNYCYAKHLLHHPFKKISDLKAGYESWTTAYHESCIEPGHVHEPDQLLLDIEVASGESDNESISDNGDPVHEYYQAAWMQEAGRRPNQGVESPLLNLGKRSVDIEYDWVEQSPDDTTINEATSWLQDQVKLSPNDDSQELPPVNYQLLKGEQRNVFFFAGYGLF